MLEFCVQKRQSFLEFGAQNRNSAIASLCHEHFDRLENVCQVLQIFDDATLMVTYCILFR